ncbi:hypothetical protein GCM10025876_11390 [Demequina litorisediminis]|uniref:Aspartate ammonia-lyase n=1 Tax=Demequina litorisediminis TaxID=1849022 RepID=A0ABQ6IC48_9MICO|nr:hypothetical protein GCM10025876_11390 [Demequina litorisediminis]
MTGREMRWGTDTMCAMSNDALPGFRIEHDTMGEVRVPADALYRAQTQRAVENFPISGIRLERRHIEALARVKKAAARANAEPRRAGSGCGRRDRRRRGRRRLWRP